MYLRDEFVDVKKLIKKTNIDNANQFTAPNACSFLISLNIRYFTVINLFQTMEK